MRLCRNIPQAISKIKTGSLSLTTASQLQTFFEKNLVLDACLRRHDTYKGSFNSSSTSLPAAECVKEKTGKKQKLL